MRMSPKDIARSSGGFTLVESVVVMVVLAIVLACIATSLSFGTRIMASQRAIANADTLASTVNTSVSDVLRTSSTVPAIGADGGSVTFTQDFVSPSRAKGSYTISPAEDGTLQIADASGDSGAFLPSGVYVDGDRVSVTFATGDAAAGKATTQVTTTVTSTQGDVLSTQTISVETLGGGA
ncbi:MAG: prepilin-type N-terminal cleavage/methylation domain-containing protein [Coriobacteriales bacterium]|nr:prepilin-type N-terminal cleavage/methylation domain-containing protein [Coriobacteriales bacterium]